MYDICSFLRGGLESGRLGAFIMMGLIYAEWIINDGWVTFWGVSRYQFTIL
jgi:hypothetical protein